MDIPGLVNDKYEHAINHLFFIVISTIILKVSGEDGEPRAFGVPSRPSGWGPPDCQGKGVCGHIDMGTAEGMRDRDGTTSRVFHRLSRCTCK